MCGNTDSNSCSLESIFEGEILYSTGWLLNACRGKKVSRDYFLNKKEKKLQKSFWS
jgi:hypothetical protein